MLGHLLGEDETVREGMGEFLEHTWRMRPEVNRFISDTFYESRLEPAPVCSERVLAAGHGLRFLPVEHEGTAHRRRRRRGRCARKSTACSARRMRMRRVRGCWSDGRRVVAPYNAQVRCLRAAIPDPAIKIGTVDKFQGQEAPVVFYSMASSSGEDVPRGLDFLFSRNRLNVAISRAKCLAYLVTSPRLLDANCRTVEQMRLANALCRFVEQAEEVPDA